MDPPRANPASDKGDIYLSQPAYGEALLDIDGQRRFRGNGIVDLGADES